MSRAEKDFYLVKRRDRLTDGKPTYYARFRNEDGDLLPWKSTCETTKTRAENWARKEWRAGRTTTRENLTFATFAANWWKWGECDYIRGKLARGKRMSRSYADIQRGNLEHYILPYFGAKKLARITRRTVEAWVLNLGERESLGAVSVNHNLATLKVMTNDAFERGLIPTNPAAKVEGVKESPKERQILTLEEVRLLFADGALSEKWEGSLSYFTLNLLAASTGLRMGEIQGLQVQHVHPGYVAVVYAWERKYGLKEPKWGSAREVPIPAKVSRYLSQVVEGSPYKEPESLVFHGRDGSCPICHKDILEALYAALQRIGISGEQRERRNVTFHSWRHLFNSLCRSRIPDYKLQRLTGHRTQEMTEHYTHLNLADFADVVALQEEALG